MGNNRISRHALALTMLIGAFLAGGSTSSHAIAATNNVGLPVIPLYFTNEINSVSNLFTWIFGVTNQDATGILIKSQVYVTNIQGDIAITPAIPANAPISLSINVDRVPIGIILFLARRGPVDAKRGVAGRGLSTPDVENPGDANFNTIFDSVETTWEDQPPIPNHAEITANLGTNVTEVDLFGLPQQFTVEGIDPATFQTGALGGGFLPTARRPTLLNTLQSFGPPWSNLIVANRARAISPNHAIHAMPFTLPSHH